MRVERTNLVTQLRHVDAALSVFGRLNGGKSYTKPKRGIRNLIARKLAWRRRHDGRNKARTATRVLQDASAQYQKRPEGRLQLLSEQGGQRSSGKRKRPDGDTSRSFSVQTNRPQRKKLNTGAQIRLSPEVFRPLTALSVYLKSECFQQFGWYISVVFVLTHPLLQLRRTSVFVRRNVQCLDHLLKRIRGENNWSASWFCKIAIYLTPPHHAPQHF